MIPELKEPNHALVVMVVHGAHQSLIDGKLTKLNLSSLDPSVYDPKGKDICFQAKFRIGKIFFIGELADGRAAVLRSTSGFHLYNLYIEEPAEQSVVL
jgi:hypothetical protein